MIPGRLAGVLFSAVDGIALRRHRQVGHRFEKGDLTLRTAEEVIGIPGRESNREGPGVGQAHILGRHPDDPSCHEKRILTSLEDPGQPVEGAIHVGTTDGLVQRGDQVVVGFTGPVVPAGLLRQEISDETGGDLSGGRGRAHLQHSQQNARVSIGQPDQYILHALLQREGAAIGTGNPAFGIAHCTSQKDPEVLFRQRFKREDGRTGEERGIHLE